MQLQIVYFFLNSPIQISIDGDEVLNQDILNALENFETEGREFSLWTIAESIFEVINMVTDTTKELQRLREGQHIKNLLKKTIKKIISTLLKKSIQINKFILNIVDNCVDDLYDSMI